MVFCWYYPFIFSMSQERRGVGDPKEYDIRTPDSPLEKRTVKYPKEKTPYGDLTDPFNQMGKFAIEQGIITEDGVMLMTSAEADRHIRQSQAVYYNQALKRGRERRGFANQEPIRLRVRGGDIKEVKKENQPENGNSRRLKGNIHTITEKHGYRCRVKHEGNGDGYVAYLWIDGAKNKDSNATLRGQTLEDILDSIERHFGESIDST